MKKFNYKKWVTDYKYGGKSLFEQTTPFQQYGCCDTNADNYNQWIAASSSLPGVNCDDCTCVSFDPVTGNALQGSYWPGCTTVPTGTVAASTLNTGSGTGSGTGSYTGSYTGSNTGSCCTFCDQYGPGGPLAGQPSTPPAGCFDYMCTDSAFMAGCITGSAVPNNSTPQAMRRPSMPNDVRREPMRAPRREPDMRTPRREPRRRR